MKRMPFSASDFVRRLVSGKCELPPSMMMSPCFEMRQQLLDHLVDRVAGLDHQHDAARPLQQLDQLFDRVRADDLRALRLVVDELVHLGDGAVEHGHLVAVVVHVQDQVLAHDGQADQADITTRVRHRIS